ncbi:MAG: tetratricopeptide repeat protein [Bacteroidota bacterium]
MKKLLVIGFMVFSGVFCRAQDSFYLVDTSLFHQLTVQERSILDSLLPDIHKEKSDTHKITLIYEMYSKMNDNDVWILYLELMNDLLAACKSAPGYKEFYLKNLAKYYNDLGYYYDYKGQTDKTWEYYNKSLDITRELNDTALLTTSMINIAMQYRFKGEIDNAVKLNLECIEMLKGTDHKHNLALAYNNLGTIYHNQAELEESLECYYRSLELFEEINDLKGAGLASNNLGSVYLETGDNRKALEYYEKCLNIQLTRNDKIDISGILFRLGSYHNRLKNYEVSLHFYKDALKYSRESGYSRNVSVALNYLGDAYDLLGHQDSAKMYYIESLKIAESIGSIPEQVTPLRSLSQIHLKEGNIDSAYIYASKGLELATAADYPTVIAHCAKVLAIVYRKRGEWEKAYKMYVLFHEKWELVRQQEQNEEIIRKQFSYEYEKKEALKEAEHIKEMAVANAAKKQQLIISIAVAAGLALALIFAYIIWRRLRITKQQKAIIESQKVLVDAKNKEILDSINYAQRIQEAFLRHEETLRQKLPPHFIIFRPKDIVSGDFYWGLEKNGHLYIAVADCTGHGVPGAMMSMLGIAFLNEINSGSELHSPAEILEKLRRKIIAELKEGGQGSAVQMKDGMDISLLMKDMKSRKAVWAGANNQLFIIPENGNEIKEIRGDKQPVGFSFNPAPFTDHELRLAKGDKLYLFSDGYVDQFGGPEGKKFKFKRFRETLLQTAKKDIRQQGGDIENILLEWMSQPNSMTGKPYEQVDDITVIGLMV